LLALASLDLACRNHYPGVHQQAPALSVDSVLGEQVDAGACASNRDRRDLAAEALGDAIEEAQVLTLGPAAERTVAVTNISSCPSPLSTSTTS
jgi:hypothetical protein